MGDCPFCDIVAGDAPAVGVYEDETTLAFLDIAPVAAGHTLVVPKRHRETLTDMDAGTTAEVFGTARRVAGAIGAALEPDGLNLVQANGEAAGQEVFHAHVHLLPRQADDDGRVRWPAGDLEAGAEVAASIRAALPAE